MKKGWQIKPLANVCEVFSDGNWIESKDQSPDGIRLIQTGNVGVGDFKDRGDKARYISEATFKRLRCTEIFEGDVLISRLPDPVGRSCILPDTGERMITAVDCSILRFDRQQFLPAFFNFYSQSLDYLKAVDEKTTGTTRNRISRGNLGQVPIPVPPLAEQQRIVGILDEAFAGLATAKANAETNLRNARALFESHLQSVFSQRGEGWVETTLENHVDLVAGFAFKSTQYTDAEDGIRLIRGDNIVQGEFRWEGVKRWPKESAEEYSKFAFAENDVVLAMDRPWVAAGLKVAYVTKDDLPLLQVQRTARLRTKKTLHWRYLFHLIRSSTFIQYLLEGQTGLGVPHISGKQILSFEFTLPPVGEQKSIVHKLDALTEETQRLTAIYTRKLAALEELKKALLHQAFSGEL